MFLFELLKLLYLSDCLLFSKFAHHENAVCHPNETTLDCLVHLNWHIRIPGAGETNSTKPSHLRQMSNSLTRSYSSLRHSLRWACREKRSEGEVWPFTLRFVGSLLQNVLHLLLMCSNNLDCVCHDHGSRILWRYSFSTLRHWHCDHPELSHLRISKQSSNDAPWALSTELTMSSI